VLDLLAELAYIVYVSVRGRDELTRLRSAEDLPIDVRTVKEAVDLFCLPEEREPRSKSLWFLSDAGANSNGASGEDAERRSG
jgi:hypothetical protein